MKKLISLLLAGAVCIGVMTACKNDENPGYEEIKASPDYSLGLVKTVTDKTYASDTLPEQPDKAADSYALDQQIEAELKNGAHTFDDPMTIVNPYGNSPLTALVLFNTDKAYKVRVTVKGTSKETDVTDTIESKTKSHRVPVIGLYAGTTNKVNIELLDDSKKVVKSNTIEIKTDVLPSSLEDMVEIRKNETTSAYGLIEVSGFGTPYPLAFDTEGSIRWYISEGYVSYGYFPLSNNRFIVSNMDVRVPTYEFPHLQELYEMDYLGRVHQIYFVRNGAHHEIIEKTPGGNLLVVSNSIDEHVEDMVEEIDRKTGAVVKSLDMRELFGETFADMLDWAHVNTASYLKDEDCVILSLRNIHAVVKLNWSTNKIKWILSDPSLWKNSGYENKLLKADKGMMYQYQQHSSYQLPYDLDNNPNTVHIMLYDNHWHKARKLKTFDNLKESYVSLYTVNEKKKTVRLEHKYESVKSKVTSNYQYDYEAGRVFAMGGYLAYPDEEDGREGMIYEYDFDTEEVLNQYSLRYTFYRAYEFDPDFNSCASALTLDGNYYKGTVRTAQKQEKNVKAPSKQVSDAVSFALNRSMLFVKALDHKVTKVEFIGKSTYAIDFSYVGEGDERYKKLNYSIPINMTELEPDSYKIVVTYKGKRYNSGHSITVTE